MGKGARRGKVVAKRRVLWSLAFALFATAAGLGVCLYPQLAYEGSFEKIRSTRTKGTTLGVLAGASVYLQSNMIVSAKFGRRKRFAWIPGETHRDTYLVVYVQTKENSVITRETVTIEGRRVLTRKEPPWLFEEPTWPQIVGDYHRSREFWEFVDQEAPESLGKPELPLPNLSRVRER